MPMYLSQTIIQPSEETTTTLSGKPDILFPALVQYKGGVINKGGIITLLNQNGLKVHGVSYSRAQANQPGWTIVF